MVVSCQYFMLLTATYITDTPCSSMDSQQIL